MPTQYFSPDYQTARERFRDVSKRLGWAVESYSISRRLADDEPIWRTTDRHPSELQPHSSELTIDVAHHRVPTSDAALVVSSGVHGVEGFFGSAVQLAMLDHWQKSAPANINVILIHSINPYGFATLRRFDENNVDLNRNFLLAGHDFRGSPPGYAKLDRLLNPQRPPSQFDFFYLQAAIQIASLGMKSLRQSIAAGQYDYPRGLFFGGRQPSESQQIFARELPRLLTGIHDTVHLDFHTGLGKSGAAKLLLDYPPTAQQRQRLIDWYGKNAFETNDQSDVAYACNGSFGNWCVSRNLTPQYLYACAEIGTYHSLRALAALRAENQSFHFSEPNDPATRIAKQNLLEIFFPASASWRNHVIKRSLEMIQQTTTGLSQAKS